MWDPTGSVEAQRIVMNQESGDFTAEQQVRSSRLPDRKAAASGAMLSEGEPIQATADRMSSTNDNKRILYEGKAILWQTGNRLQADRVLIDRGDKKLQAEGNVVSQFLDTGEKKSGFTTIRAASLEYRDTDRLAWYRGGVRLLRDGMDVKSSELRAWMKEPPKEPTPAKAPASSKEPASSKADALAKDPASAKDSGKEGDSRLERAFADGAVEIVQASPGRTRRGSAEHAEYYVDEEKVVLYGGHPQVVDSVKGTTRGRKLTYWANSDSFQGDGTETQPSVSTIKRK
jgi:lipopolysaccharide export system protein LptA